jgi:hypothetical protein
MRFAPLSRTPSGADRPCPRASLRLAQPEAGLPRVFLPQAGDLGPHHATISRQRDRILPNLLTAIHGMVGDAEQFFLGCRIVGVGGDAEACR